VLRIVIVISFEQVNLILKKSFSTLVCEASGFGHTFFLIIILKVLSLRSQHAISSQNEDTNHVISTITSQYNLHPGTKDKKLLNLSAIYCPQKRERSRTC